MTEGEIQKAVFANLRTRGMPGVVFWHCPNDRASRRKAGYLAGAADVMVLHHGEFFALELKALDGEPSSAQMGFVKDVQAAKGCATFAYGIHDALSTLEAWGILRKVA